VVCLRTWSPLQASGPYVLVCAGMAEKNPHPNFGAETSHLQKFGCNIEIVSTHNLFCQKFVAVCRNSVVNCQRLSERCNFVPRLLFCLPTSLTVSSIDILACNPVANSPVLSSPPNVSGGSAS